MKENIKDLERMLSAILSAAIGLKCLWIIISRNPEEPLAGVLRKCARIIKAGIIAAVMGGLIAVIATYY